MTVVFNKKIDGIIKNRVIHGPKKAYKNLSKLEATLMENHLSDPSTGTYRERAAILLSGATALAGQFDYDAKRDGLPIECKPKTWNTGKKANADGCGCINEHSMSRHMRFINDSLIMQQSQFFDVECAWIVEFPYSFMADHMVKQIAKSKDRVLGRFRYNQWIDCPDLKLQWINHSLIERNRQNIVGGPQRIPNKLYKWLMEQPKINS